MRQLIAGNWKMNGLTEDSAQLAQQVANAVTTLAIGCEVLICPPFTQLAPAATHVKGSAVALGAQDCHQAASGAHTGDISAPMLRDIGCSYVILGHSERRQNHGEIDETVRQKAVAAAESGLVPIVCVGETDEQRQNGQQAETVGWQLEGSLPKGFSGVVAYEPVWAIGTGKSASAADVADMHAFIRAELVRQFGEAGQAVRILYGGSVKPANARELLAIPDVNGALVGGASLVVADFIDIAQAAQG